MKRPGENVFLCGATAPGQSKFLEHLIRQDIKNHREVFLVDPSGTLIRRLKNAKITRQ